MECIKASFKEEVLPGGGRSRYPFVSAILYINNDELGIVDFLIDTGSGVTIISPRDSIRLGISRARTRTLRIIGVAGTEAANVITGDIRLELLDEEQDRRLVVKLDRIAYRRLPKARGREYQQQLRIPSILGWDVLQKLVIKIDYIKNTIEVCKP